MVLSAFAEMRILTERPSASEIRVTLSRLGRNRRLVLMLEWLTLCPTCAVLPVKSHRHDICVTSKLVDCLGPVAGGCGRAIGPLAAHPQLGGPIVSAGNSVKPRDFMGIWRW